MAVDPTCPHMGCFVEWEAEAENFVCPCHGSKFAPDGSLIEGPAIEPLENYAVKIEFHAVFVQPKRLSLSSKSGKLITQTTQTINRGDAITPKYLHSRITFFIGNIHQFLFGTSQFVDLWHSFFDILQLLSGSTEVLSKFRMTYAGSTRFVSDCFIGIKRFSRF